MREKREPKLCICGDHYWVPLTKSYITMVSPEDADILSGRAMFKIRKHNSIRMVELENEV